MKKVGVSTICLLLCLLFAGCCHTVLKPHMIVNYPANLTKEEAKIATIFTFSKKDLKEWNNWEKMVDGALSASMRFYSSPRKKGWEIESVTDNIIELGYTCRKHYLRCGVTYQDKSCNLEIIGSENLKETTDSIHRTSLMWLNMLEVTIRRAFGQVSLSKTQKNKSPDVITINPD